MIEFLELPPLLGRTDEAAEAELARRRDAAREWMRSQGITDLSVPSPIDPLHAMRVVWSRQPTEGKQ